MPEQTDPKNVIGGGTRGQRGPNYPYIDLPTALQRVRQIYDNEGRNPAPVTSIATHWNYKPTSSSTDKVIGALNAYGLINSTGGGDDRMIQISDRARDIIEDEREVSKERDEALRLAALGPSIHRDIREKYGASLPSDATLRTYLIRDRGYNPKKADGIIANYRATVQHANLDSAPLLEDNPQSSHNNELPLKTGDWVQWESQGALQFEQPKRVAKIEAHGDEHYVFVEGANGAIPINQIIAVEQHQGTSPMMTPPLADKPPAPKVGTEHATFPLPEGYAVIEWPSSISQDSYNELQDWVDLMMKRAKRSIGQPDPSAS